MSPSASFWKVWLQTPSTSWKWNKHKWLHGRWYGVNLLSDNNGLTMYEYKTGWTMIFIMNMKVEQWYLQDVNFKFTPSHACFNYFPEFICPHMMIPLILLINMTFLWHLRMSRLKKILPQGEHTNPTPKWTFLTWAQIVACEVDGPSLQPSTWHLYTHLMPPPEHRGVACGLEWPPLKLREQLERKVLLSDLQDWRLQVLWTPEGVVGRWWCRGHGMAFWKEVGMGEGGSEM